jgi:benzoyl-CoA reductase subunit A
MKCVIGIDLGSTTTKAVILDEDAEIIGRGITNSRSNYDLAASDARFRLVARNLPGDEHQAELERLHRAFRLEQTLGQLARLHELIDTEIQADGLGDRAAAASESVAAIMRAIELEERAYFGSENPSPRSNFFRDAAGSAYTRYAEDVADPRGVTFDDLIGLYDKCIIRVENEPLQLGFDGLISQALHRLDDVDTLVGAVEQARETGLEESAMVGTGYGRATLPFPKEAIRSEILCHGLGAHVMFPETRTVLDIGGQDTKAIQVDESGIVTSFQMNDRCAAGCGRYLGYIADEMNMGLHELGPMAQQSTRCVKINSTCTVFAGAELRERLSLGEKREDILAGLHRAIILRAMSLLARSGGVRDQFTFTGGVANNRAAVAALEDLVEQNYGDRRLNISPDSIYTGALGGALFAHRLVN